MNNPELIPVMMSPIDAIEFALRWGMPEPILQYGRAALLEHTTYNVYVYFVPKNRTLNGEVGPFVFYDILADRPIWHLSRGGRVALILPKEDKPIAVED